MLRKARQGVYREASFRETEPSLREKYFIEKDGFWRISDAVKKHVDFIHLNLLDRSKIALLGAMDVILCRNVIIYFDAGEQAPCDPDLPREAATRRPSAARALGVADQPVERLRAASTCATTSCTAGRCREWWLDDPWNAVVEAAIERVDDTGFER